MRIILPVVIAAAAVAALWFSGILTPAYTGNYEGFTEIRDRQIQTDEDSGIDYVNNTILAIVDSGLTDDEKKELVRSISGKTIGEIESTVDVLQIRVKSGSPDELQELAEELAEDDSVYFASYDYVVGSEGSASAMLASIFGESEWTGELGSLYEDAGEAVSDLYENLFGNSDAEDPDTEEDAGEEEYLLSEVISELME